MKAPNENTAKEAKAIEMRCCAPLWWGYGAPAGHCNAPAYGPQKHMRDEDRWWTEPQIARCPDHGGPTVEEFHQWLMKQILA